MTVRRVFNFASLLSLLLGILIASVSVYRWYRYIPEAERKWEEDREIVAAATLGDREYGDKYSEAVNNMRVWDSRRYQFFTHDMDAAYEAEHRVYIVLPRRIVLGLAALPAIWFVANWLRLRGKPPAQPRLMRIVQRWPHHVFGPAALACAVLLVGLGGIWIRSYSHSDIFINGYLADARSRASIHRHEVVIGKGKLRYAFKTELNGWTMVRLQMESARPQTNVVPYIGYAHLVSPAGRLGHRPGEKSMLGFDWFSQASPTEPPSTVPIGNRPAYRRILSLEFIL